MDIKKFRNLYSFTDKQYYEFFEKEKKINNIITQHENFLLMFISFLFAFSFFGFLTSYIYTNYIIELFSLSFFTIFVFVNRLKKTFKKKTKLISRRVINTNIILYEKLMEKRISAIENKYTEEEKYLKSILGYKVKNLKEIRKILRLNLLKDSTIEDIINNYELLEKINYHKLISKIILYRNNLRKNDWSDLIQRSKNKKLKRILEKERAKALFLLIKLK